MTYEEKYNELVELSHNDNLEIKRKADAWLISIGLQGTAELKVSAFLLDLAIKNVKGEITRDEVSQLLESHYANMLRPRASAVTDWMEIMKSYLPILRG